MNYPFEADRTRCEILRFLSAWLGSQIIFYEQSETENVRTAK